ncbi:hypothetical protein BGY98DRAFT_1011126 [Russula aff. rugulosa BPL654]|nr:hypothetical protein BGY98DRAFT_1011126 [Russula aff. rugulosa BPL654]
MRNIYETTGERPIGYLRPIEFEIESLQEESLEGGQHSSHPFSGGDFAQNKRNIEGQVKTLYRGKWT